MITKVLLEHVHYDGERPTAVVRLQISDVLEHESRGPLLLQDADHIEEQGSLCQIGETMRPAQGVLLGHASNREWLTGKAC